MTAAVNEKTAFIVYVPPFKLYYYPSILRNAELRRIRTLKRQNQAYRGMQS